MRCSLWMLASTLLPKLNAHVIPNGGFIWAAMQTSPLSALVSRRNLFVVSHKIKLPLKTHVTYHRVRQIVWLCDCPRNLTASPPSYCGLVANIGVFTSGVVTLLLASQRKDVAERGEGELNMEQTNNIPCEAWKLACFP